MILISTSKKKTKSVFIKKSTLTLLGLFIFTAGVTISSALTGAQSSLYFFFLMIGILFCTPHLLYSVQSSYKMRLAILFAFTPLLFYLLQLLLLQDLNFINENPEIYIGFVLSILFAISAGSLDEILFKRLVYLIGTFHIAIGLYAISTGAVALSAQAGTRFSSLGLRETVWSEIILGCYVASILSQRKWLIALSIIVAGVIIKATEMRGSGLAIVISLIFYIFYSMDPVGRLRLVFSCLMKAIMLLPFTDVTKIASNALLLDDPYRGVDAGFSGRFDTWRDGIDLFFSSPFIGVGLYDPIASYVHNGFIRLLAQFGIIYSVIALAVLMIAIKRSFIARRPDLTSALICYCIFIFSAPRYINFQLMPFMGMVAVAFACMQRKLHTTKVDLHNPHHACS